MTTSSHELNCKYRKW